MKAALITGGTRGIGFGIAKCLAGAKFDLAINGVRSEEEVKNALEELRDFGVKVIYCRGNIAIKTDRESILQKSIDVFGAVQVLVSNAGVAPPARKDVLELNEEEYDAVMDVNLKGTFFMTQEFARTLLHANHNNPEAAGCIVLISSVSADFASVNRAAYCISKTGVGMITRLMATRLGEAKIPVYEVRPGIIGTDMTSAVKEKYGGLIRDGLTIEQRWGTPEDVGKLVCALVNGDIPYSTGHVFYADGGMMVRRL